eukprot:COSAG05_NODE_182_length_14772_cov_42.430655_18_plen_283_part_00
MCVWRRQPACSVPRRRGARLRTGQCLAVACEAEAPREYKTKPPRVWEYKAARMVEQSSFMAQSFRRITVPIRDTIATHSGLVEAVSIVPQRPPGRLRARFTVTKKGKYLRGDNKRLLVLTDEGIGTQDVNFALTNFWTWASGDVKSIGRSVDQSSGQELFTLTIREEVMTFVAEERTETLSSLHNMRSLHCPREYAIIPSPISVVDAPSISVGHRSGILYTDMCTRPGTKRGASKPRRSHATCRSARSRSRSSPVSCASSTRRRGTSCRCTPPPSILDAPSI